MKKLTVKKALQETLRIWSRLARSGDSKKPRAEFRKFKNGCPCCEYVVQQTEDKDTFRWGMPCAEGDSPISQCPMRTVWPNGCENYDIRTPYNRWLYEDKPSGRKRLAATIATGARNLLRQLEARQAK